ncbi:MAG: tyrosine--tRNA ligase [Desulfovibrionaceae bacterium CG1_02_65_16]|nr:MAG: tyrosine--tRNA ligase [Desulfovibrionaceae bacterium CG1_02_65_16]
MNIYDELSWRGLVHQVSDADGLRKYLDTPGAAMYCGFDPTAESLHIGNLVPLLSLVRMLRAGHKPIFLLGGATGLIGDPSGKDKERELSDQLAVQARADRIKAQMEAFVLRNTGQKPTVVNNYDWVKNMSAIELLRDVGKHFTVNWMLGKDSVKGRIEREEVGISYTEFSYMILQGYDFYHLCREYGCRLQIGGGDQWGNITAGCELIRKKAAGDAYALTFPLITTASGKKFGKSEKGAIFMSTALTSPYAFYQFWINTDDADVVRFLKYFTFLTQEEIAALEAEMVRAPQERAAQKALAAQTTIMVHGEEELAKVLAATEALFGKGDLKSLDPGTLAAALESAPAREYAFAALPDLPQILVDLGLCPSKGQARKDIQAGAVSLDGEKITDATRKLTEDDFFGEVNATHGAFLVLRKGKKNYGLVRLG